MKIIEWLKNGDATLTYLTSKYLLEESAKQKDEGYIERYLSLYDESQQGWGDNIYNGKWISTTYTLLELRYMEISPNHPYYQDSARKVLDELWKNHGRVSKTRFQDMCMSGMALSLACYGKIEDDRTNEIIDYILDHQMVEGGWNCAWDNPRSYSVKASVHTTITILEALFDVDAMGLTYRQNERDDAVRNAEKYLLDREFFLSITTKKPIHVEMTRWHYPVRWHYDCFRGLEYFARAKRKYSESMDKVLDMIRQEMERGPINKGKAYSGKIHFPLEQGRKSRFNTFRALLILKQYDWKFYNEIAQKNFAD